MRVLPTAFMMKWKNPVSNEEREREFLLYITSHLLLLLLLLLLSTSISIIPSMCHMAQILFLRSLSHAKAFFVFGGGGVSVGPIEQKIGTFTIAQLTQLISAKNPRLEYQKLALTEIGKRALGTSII